MIIKGEDLVKFVVDAQKIGKGNGIVARVCQGGMFALIVVDADDHAPTFFIVVSDDRFSTLRLDKSNLTGICSCRQGTPPDETLTGIVDYPTKDNRSKRNGLRQGMGERWEGSARSDYSIDYNHWV